MIIGKKVWLFFGLVFLISVLVSLYVMFFAPGHIEVTHKNFKELMDSGDLVMIVAIVVSLTIVAVVMINLYRTLNPAEVKNGILTSAEVVEVWDTGTTLNENPQVKLLLKIRKIGGTYYQAEVKTIVSRLNAAQVRPGCKAEVKYDPEKPGRIQLMRLDLAPADRPLDETAARLENLAILHEKGLITEEEYKARRQEILKEV